LFSALDLIPKHFDNKNLKAPTITLPEKSSVLLRCTVELLNGVEQFDDVEYSIEWFADGKSLNVETKRCDQKAKVPCPTPEKEISSRLPGSKYRAGKWVRNGSTLFVCSFVVVTFCCCYVFS